jgi:hypothetical protein
MAAPVPLLAARTRRTGAPDGVSDASVFGTRASVPLVDRRVRGTGGSVAMTDASVFGTRASVPLVDAPVRETGLSVRVTEAPVVATGPSVGLSTPVVRVKRAPVALVHSPVEARAARLACTGGRLVHVVAPMPRHGRAPPPRRRTYARGGRTVGRSESSFMRWSAMAASGREPSVQSLNPPSSSLRAHASHA